MKLLERLTNAARLRHLSDSTIVCYQNWVRQFLRFHRNADGTWKHPGKLHRTDLAGFLTHLATKGRAAASTQNQALCAIVFLYKQALGEALGAEDLGKVRRFVFAGKEVSSARWAVCA